MASLHYVLTSPRTAEVLVRTAGSGKTRTLAEAPRTWQAPGRPVIGLATAQAARNVLPAAGVPLAANTAQFLGRMPRQRGALGTRSRQYLYSAMTRGAQSKQAIAFTTPRVADPGLWYHPAGPELARHERMNAERAGEPVQQPADGIGLTQTGWDCSGQNRLVTSRRGI